MRQTKEAVLSWGVYDCWDHLCMYVADTQLCKVDAVPLRTCVNSTSWAETSKSEAGCFITLGITLVEGGVVLVHYFGAVLVYVMMVALSVLCHF